MSVKKCATKELVRIIKGIDPINGCDMTVILPCGSELKVVLIIKVKQKRLTLVKVGQF
jgi:hypothetical protein